MAHSLRAPALQAPYHCCMDDCKTGPPFYEFRQENTQSLGRWASTHHWYTHLCKSHLDELRRPGEFAKLLKC